MICCLHPVFFFDRVSGCAVCMSVCMCVHVCACVCVFYFFLVLFLAVVFFGLFT